MIIAIDGPSGTGKSTVAKGVAKALNYPYFNTGATYRSLTWYFLKNAIEYTDEKKGLAAIEAFRKEFRYDEVEQKYWIGDIDITPDLHSLEVTEKVSESSAFPYVRAQMVPLQRDFAKDHKNSLFEGRDIGTVVFPDADLKIFLTARPEVRAERRLKDFQKKGEKVTFDEVLKSINERDHTDMTRKTSPLRQADDAILVDSSDLTIDGVMQEILKRV